MTYSIDDFDVSLTDELIKKIIDAAHQVDLNNLTLAEQAELVKLLEAKNYYEAGRLFYRWFDNRNGYDKHLAFLAAGTDFRQRAFLAGNRVGKSQTGAFEVTCHATGLYPSWWIGKRFDKPTSGWVVGKTAATVRETVQVALLGDAGSWGTGMLPRELILTPPSQASVPQAHVIQVQHISGGISTIVFKTNDSGRQSFEGTSKDYIWIDEEADLDVYFECLTRTMTTNGVIFTTFTPLKGLTPLIKSLLKDGNLDTPAEGISITTCGWDDAPHLDEATKKEMLARLPPWQRLSRSKGVPSLGAGVIYPIDPIDYTVKSFEIPPYWLKLASLDVGWNRTACLWLAKNPEDGVTYAYAEHYRGQAEPLVHAEAIKARGKVPMVIDSAAHGRSQIDGENLFKLYSDLGLDLNNANKAVEAGLYTVWSMLSFSKLKIFDSCTNLLSEMKTYRRDEKGAVVKSDDHLCDCLRYGVMTQDVARSDVPKKIDLQQTYNKNTRTGL
jgi:phage terminase large subunit-like protein